MKTVILILVTISMLACTKTNNQQQHAPIKVVDIYTPTAAKPTTPAHYNQSKTLVNFKQSNSKTNGQSIDKILHKELRSDTLIIKVRSNQNGDTHYQGNFNFTDNNLNLSLTQLPKIITRKSGQTDTIYTSQTFSNTYEFTYTINHIRALPQTITLNGKIIN